MSIENNKFSNNTQSVLFTFNLVLSDKIKQKIFPVNILTPS